MNPFQRLREGGRRHPPGGTRAAPLQVTLYGKPGCHLCDDAEAALGRLGVDLPVSVQKIDITGDPAVYERYRYRIPVVAVDGDVLAEGKVTERRLRAACAERGWLSE